MKQTYFICLWYVNFSYIYFDVLHKCFHCLLCKMFTLEISFSTPLLLTSLVKQRSPANSHVPTVSCQL